MGEPKALASSMGMLSHLSFPQGEDPEEPGKGHWLSMSPTLPHPSHLLQLHGPACRSL